jgi:hydrogenase expression/formation protein HypC
MCLAVPVQVAEILENDLVRCRMGESDTFVTASSMLLEEAPRLGDYLILHAGFALRKLDPADAEDTLALMREMTAAAEDTYW